jgi:hypothetical protein
VKSRGASYRRRHVSVFNFKSAAEQQNLPSSSSFLPLPGPHMALRGALRAGARALAPLPAGGGAASAARLAHGAAPAPQLTAAGVRPLLGAHPRALPRLRRAAAAPHAPRQPARLHACVHTAAMGAMHAHCEP